MVSLSERCAYHESGHVVAALAYAIPIISVSIDSATPERSATEQLAKESAQHMKDVGNTIYSFACVVAATVLGIGFADYWFGQQQFTALLSWAVLAAIPWLVGRASLYVLARLEDRRHHIALRSRTQSGQL
jgi:hypothetical protein